MFFSRLVRSSFAAPKYIRKFSGHSEEDARKEVIRWYQISLGAIAVCIVSSAYILATDEHVHAEKPDLYVTKTKPFPWKCPECNLFDQHCWDECKAAKSGESSHH